LLKTRLGFSVKIYSRHHILCKAVGSVETSQHVLMLTRACARLEAPAQMLIPSLITEPTTSEVEYSLTIETSRDVASAYTTHDHHFLRGKRKFSGSVEKMKTDFETSFYKRESDSPTLGGYTNAREKADYDEGDMWAENENLRDALKKLEQSAKKLSRNETVILRQLEDSEQDRYTLEGKLSEVRDECNTAIKNYNEALKQLRLTTVELDAMTLKWKLSEQQADCVAETEIKTVTNNESKEIENKQRVEKPSLSLRELRLKNIELLTIVKSQETSIQQLEDTIRALKEKESCVEDRIYIGAKVFLSEELASHDIEAATKDEESKTNQNMAFEELKQSVIPEPTLIDLKMRRGFGAAATRREFWEVVLRHWVKTSKKTVFWSGFFLVGFYVLLHRSTTTGDDARVNAWWYLKEKYPVKNKIL
ncbi:hypothetical protein PSTT_16186, partial [Puccinia striiformis]